MSELRCEHGALVGRVPDWRGGWCGGVIRCKCCHGVEGYLNSSSMGFGPDNAGQGYSRFWTPTDLCGQCGGKYVEHRYGPSQDQASANRE